MYAALTGACRPRCVLKQHPEKSLLLRTRSHAKLQNDPAPRSLLTGSAAGLVAAATSQRGKSHTRKAGIWTRPGRCFLARQPSISLVWIVLVYVLSSIGVYGICEGWQPEDSVYFSITALTTVGYGDLVPSHPASRLFFSVAILLALVLLAARLSSFVHELVQRETGEAAGRLNQQLKIKLGQASEEDIFDEEGERRRLRTRFLRQLQLLTTYLFLSSFISKRALGLSSSWEAVYFSVVTLTTIGFGDFVPQTAAAKWIVSLLCLVGVPIFGGTLAELVALIYGERQRGIKQRMPRLTVEKLLQMRRFAEELHSRGLLGEKAEDEIQKLGEHRISQFEFCCFLLVQNDIIGMDDVEVISKNFLQLDLSGDGALWSKDALAWELQRMLSSEKVKDEPKAKKATEDEENDISRAEAEKLRNSLDAIDMQTAGCIELLELERALEKVGVEASSEYVEKFFSKLDLNGDGRISFQEYQELIRNMCARHCTAPAPLGTEPESLEQAGS